VEPQTDSLKERWWLIIYVAAVSILVGFVFRRWLFSDQMLFSHDLIVGGNFFRKFLQTQLFEHGSFPCWNPYIGCGVPFVDAIHGGAFYLSTIPELCGNIFRTVGYSFMLHFVLASLFAYLAARELGLSRLGATVSGVAYGLSPCLISWVAPGHDGKIYTSTWFPLVVLYLERTLTRYRFCDCALLGLVYGVVILTPHLQLAYYVGLFIAAYTLFRLGAEFKRSRQFRMAFRGGALVMCGIVLALMIAAVQLLPSWQYLVHNSPRAEELRGLEFASKFSLHEEEVLSLLVPEFSGTNFKDGPAEYWGRNPSKDNSESPAPLVILLALLGAVTAGVRHRFFWWSAASGVLIYAVGATTPVYRYIIAVVPFLDSMEAPSGAMFIFVFCAAILAGSAVDRFSTQDRAVWTKTGLILAIGLPSLVTLGAVLFALDGERFLQTYCGWLRPEILPQGDQVPAKWNAALAHIPYLTRGFWFSAAQLWLGVVWLLAGANRRRRALWLIPVTIAIGSALFAQRFVVPIDPARVYDPVRAVAEVERQDRLARALEVGIWEKALHMDYFGVQNVVGSCDREPLWFSEVVGGCGRRNLHNPRFLNLAGVRYPVVSHRHRPPQVCGSTPITDTLSRLEAFSVLVNECAYPRVFLVDRCLVIPNRSALIDSVLHGAVDLRQCALLEEEPADVLSDSGSVGDSAWVVSYEPNRVEVETRSTGPRLLVLTDTWFDAWRVYVNGVEEKVCRAYGTFRAVAVPTGTSRVVFEYRPTTLRLGALLTLMGLLIVAITIASQSIRLRKAAGTA